MKLTVRQQNVLRATIQHYVNTAEPVGSKSLASGYDLNVSSATIRNAMSLTCRIRLVDQRTHTIWQNWLTFMDSTPPILPEPEWSL